MKKVHLNRYKKTVRKQNFPVSSKWNEVCGKLEHDTPIFMIKRLIFLFSFVMLSMSIIKPGQLKNIAKVDFILNQKEIYPGNQIELSLLTTLKDSTEIFSAESNTTINFANYLFELKKGAKIIEKSRTKLVLQISDDAYNDPYVEFSIHLRRRPSVFKTIYLPILYDVPQKVYFSGKNGYDPRTNSNDGYRKIPVAGRVNIEFIDNEQTLTNNSDPNIIGEKGPNLDVYISLIRSIDQSEFLQVLIRKEFGGEITKYVKVGAGILEIFSVGGKGGISKYGGKGGDGGDVTVFITKSARPYFNQVFIINHGGDGGELWRPLIDGQQSGPYGNDGAFAILPWDN